MDTKIKAMVYSQFGPPEVLKLMEVDKPAPNPDQALVKVRAASVNPADYHTMRGVPLFIRLTYKPARDNGLWRPNNPRLGSDLAGIVEAVGSSVSEFKPGDEVFGTSLGSFGEYAVAREARLVMKPANGSFEDAAAIPVAASTALQGFRYGGKIEPGQKVLIDGASGGVGTFAVQIAKSYGAEVTAVCSTQNLDTARSIGADHVIDYTKEDFTKNGQQYDLIMNINGYHPILAYRRSLIPKGIFVMVGGAPAHLYQALMQVALLGPLISRSGGQKMGFMGITKINKDDLVYLQGLFETGKIKPVIDRRYPLRETAEALRYLEQGHARGKVIITVDQDR